MSTTTVAIEITCPDWCTVTPAEHAAELWENGGECIHRSEEWMIPDLGGYTEPLTPTRYHKPVSVMLTTTTTPEGREQASPVVFMNGRECSLEQAGKVAEVLAAVVERHQAAGGVVSTV